MKKRIVEILVRDKAKKRRGEKSGGRCERERYVCITLVKYKYADMK